MVYTIPGGIIERIVIVKLTNYQLNHLRIFQKILQNRCMRTFYSHVFVSIFKIPSIMINYSSHYGYAQEHHTVKLSRTSYSQIVYDIMEKIDEDVLNNGTLPSCWRLLDGTINGWNKCIGNVDAICKTFGYHTIKRRSNTDPGFLLWKPTFQYMLYQSFRINMYSKMERHITSYVIFRQFQDKEKHTISFRSFLDELKKRNNLCITRVMECYPGLIEKSDRGTVLFRVIVSPPVII